MAIEGVGCDDKGRMIRMARIASPANKNDTVSCNLMGKNRLRLQSNNDHTGMSSDRRLSHSNKGPNQSARSFAQHITSAPFRQHWPANNCLARRFSHLGSSLANQYLRYEGAEVRPLPISVSPRRFTALPASRRHVFPKPPRGLRGPARTSGGRLSARSCADFVWRPTGGGLDSFLLRGDLRSRLPTLPALGGAGGPIQLRLRYSD